MAYRTNQESIDPKVSGLITWLEKGQERTEIFTDLYYEGGGALSFRIVEEHGEGWKVHDNPIRLSAADGKAADVLLMADVHEGALNMGVLLAMSSLFHTA